jgi:hypothetical protein
MATEPSPLCIADFLCPLKTGMRSCRGHLLGASQALSSNLGKLLLHLIPNSLGLLPATSHLLRVAVCPDFLLFGYKVTQPPSDLCPFPRPALLP